MTTKDMNWYTIVSNDCVSYVAFIFPICSVFNSSFCLIGEFSEGILCVLPNVTTSKQGRLLQDIVKHGDSTCTRGHTGE